MAILPYSRAGITGAAMLGLGRAIGETIAVTIVIGNAPEIGKQIFDQGYTLAAVIANEFGEAANDPLHRVRADRGRPRAVRAHADRERGRALVREPRPRAARERPRRRRRGGGGMSRSSAISAAPPAQGPDRCAACSRAATVLALVPLVLILYYLIKKGIGAWSGSFFTTDPNGNFLGDPGGIKSAILGTIEMVGARDAIAVPVGIGVALYLTEYGRDEPLREGRALLRRRDDGRAVDRLRPVHLHHAGRERRGRRLRRLEGLGRARAADAAGRDPLGRGRAAARAGLAARGRRSRSARRAGGW